MPRHGLEPLQQAVDAFAARRRALVAKEHALVRSLGPPLRRLGYALVPVSARPAGSAPRTRAPRRRARR
jgi:hypothetical protein